ncbi:MAG: transposase, partial [Anaerolineae bacterium]
RSHRPGFEHVTRLLDALLTCGEYQQVVLGHEPTGVYHEAWARALLERYAAYRYGSETPALDYRFLNPLWVKRKRQQLAGGRPRKTDRLDLLAIAHCLRDGLGQPAALPTGDELRFQLWATAYRRAQRERRGLTVSLLSQLDRLWPGAVVNVRRFRQAHPDLSDVPLPLVLSKPLERQRVQAILQHCPNPHHFLALGQAGIQAFFRQYIGRCGPATAKLAFQVVQKALLPPPEVAQLLAVQLQADFARYQTLSQRLQTLSDQTQALVPDTPAAVLTTVPGISPLLAVRYLAYLGHHQRFQRPAQIWALAGFDPATDHSGDRQRWGKISRKGHPGLRDTLYLIGLHTAKNIPAIDRARQRARANGKGPVGAVIHAAHKANRLCHRLLYDQVPFDPDRRR